MDHSALSRLDQPVHASCVAVGPAGLLILGGAMDAWNDEAYPHLGKAVSLIRSFETAGKPVLGICLGCQLIARAYGGKVYRLQEEEVGFVPLQATEAGVSRGQCAEYCGGAHALMSFHVDARERPGFDEWLGAENRPAVRTDGEGARLFVASGCGACHRIRGLASADGRIGPDLTHVASRRSLAAATLTNDATAFAAWIRDNQHIKPGNRMPPYRVLSDDELRMLAQFLVALQ